LHIAGKHCPSDILAWKRPGVTVHGQVPDASAFLLQHPIVVVPLLAGGGMRVKVLEALALGRALVSTTVGLEGIPAQAGTHVLVADTPTAFAEAVLQLLAALDEPEFGDSIPQSLGRRARAFVEQHYAWAELTHNLGMFYENLVSPRTSLA
jgi:polysaccharide biosynthesis protein PslH